MDGLMKRVVLVIFVLGILWKASESHTLDFQSYDGYDNRILPRFNRQTQGQTDEGKKCRTPAQPQHGNWTYLNDSTKGEANIETNTYTVITFKCDVGYKLSSTNDDTHTIFCGQNGDWGINVMPTCQRLCSKVYNTPLITVSCNTDGSIVPCDKATDNTILTYRCAPYYETPYGNPRKSICYDGSWDYLPVCIPVCGQKRISATPLIINGQYAERGNYPWVVALYSNKETIPNYTNICGGSLITPEIVLTAAHCVTKADGKVDPQKYYRVGAGKYYIQYQDPRDNDTAQYSEVEDIKVHPEYRGGIQNYRANIALLRLKTPFALSKVVQPVCYNNLPYIEPEAIGVVTGWGYTETGQPSEKLKELELPYIDSEQCFNELDPDFAQKYFTSDKMCAGSFNKNTSVCRGDSGGGLVFRDPLYKDKFFIQGILAIGYANTEQGQVRCNSQKPALYTKVEYYTEWIQLTVLRWKKENED